MAKIHIAQFAPGQIVKHTAFGYRALIFDVDATYSQSPEWYDIMAEGKPRKDRPWYHILVDGEDHTTYVAECNLEICHETDCFEHPMMDSLFDPAAHSVSDYAARFVVN
ncbi:heat shock protein HspQ [Kordiimonas sediminis]|uniref:Heat shock protein HspQ n=1 Tax=Kordiimonas sediminis TaxID=1735581 RepID=A0A919ATK6_9PROT|nr:heat shock protein HspQ [Kordiimonas sediminis]GHF25641.1 heat shock protein HspQ [Kordiimonas sediminis]